MADDKVGQHATPPADLPADPAAFYGGGIDMAALDEAPPPEAPPVLERLGPPSFRPKGFPLLGFLVGVYDHVAAQVGGGRAIADRE